MVQVKKTTVTSAQMLAIMTTPIVILPAPTSGYVNNVLGITVAMTYGGAPYSYSGTNRLKIFSESGSTASAVTANIMWQDNNDLLKISDNVMIPLPKQITSSVFSTTKDLKISSPTNPSGGTSDVSFIISYDTKLIG